MAIIGSTLIILFLVSFQNLVILNGQEFAAEGRGTIVPAPNFNAQADAKVLRSALKGGGTKDKRVIGIVAGRSNAQRQQIREAYRQQYTKLLISNRDLLKDIKGDTSGNYEKLLVALMTPTAQYNAKLGFKVTGNPATYFAKRLRKDMRGLGTKDNDLIKIITSRSEIDLEDIKREYNKLYKKSLEAAVRGDVTGHYQDLLVAIIRGNRRS
ncbi:unnamed protein product [Gordionus sp. m RMFG-2023]|uniref:annexin A7-like n=1 Tax=Gordionus sp. m RMFG-2023 TaxID=3053472 RepID=UPI0030E1E2EF